MLGKLVRHKRDIAIGFILVVLLACVRGFEDALFYDPFLDYFKVDFTSLPFPEIDGVKLTAHLFLRYLINSVLSLGIIFVIFRNADLVKFASILYVVFFIILILAFFVVLQADESHKMILFYIRRFIIQPLFLLLFVPAFYFQESASAKNNVS